jgi:hypothetical protein
MIIVIFIRIPLVGLVKSFVQQYKFGNAMYTDDELAVKKKL